jgi:predicted secreted protein
VFLTRGESFAVQLEENPTTGFGWELLPYDREVVSLRRDEFRAGDAVRAGSGGRHLWVFEALAPGRGTLRWAYRRSWERQSTIKEFSLEATVRGQ